MTKVAQARSWSPREAYAGKNIILSGTTGFLGKVVLALLFDRCPEIGKVFALIRPGASDRSRERFDKSVITSPAFGPLREKLGADFDDFIADRVVPIDGNITKENCGFDDETLELLEREGVDLFLNSAGLVDFDPPVDHALAINAVGAKHVVDVCERLDAALIHVSTCFVAGLRSGQILEDEPIVNRVPPGFEERGQAFDYDAEIGYLAQLAAEVRARANDPRLTAQWREEARAKLQEEGRDPDNPTTMRAGILRQRKIWLALELKRVGMERSQFWGWTNTYTFTKAIGEMAVADAVAKGRIRASIVRPSIVESSLSFPFPGWNEGFTTTAPLILMVRKGLLNFPAAKELILDVIPCDMVSSVIAAAGAAIISGHGKLVYQAASGDSNPMTIHKALELTAWEGRTRARNAMEKSVTGFWRRHNETQPVAASTYRRLSIPLFKKAAKGTINAVDKVGPDRLGWARQPASFLRELAADVEETSTKVDTILELFIPFVADNAYVFRCENSRELVGKIRDDERDGFRFDPASYKWRDYFLDVHIPGLQRWVFPKLEAELEAPPPQAYMHRDLVELFEASTHAHRHRMAFELLLKDGGVEHLTFGELHTLARRVGGFLEAQGVASEDRVGIVCENRPEWAACYFGILRAGATVVPIDQGAKGAEIANILRASGAKGAFVSPAVLERLSEDGFDVASLGGVWSMGEGLCHRAELLSPKAPAQVASLIFTSGTTGNPKGVQLSHRNFTFEVSRLAGIFEVDEDDHLLSVLPLHHTFEFTAGFLLPLSRGTRITYLEAVDGDMLQRALKAGVSGLIGVPALWQLLQRRIENQMGDRGVSAALVMEGIKQVNLFVRDRLNLNVGSITAYPVHRALGGRLKFLVSGGSALDPQVMEFFRGLGFNMTEGYGLTETAPVLTVTNPNDKVLPGSVGKAIHGVEIRIDGANDEGVGEVLARGPNVMLGYYGDDEANEAVFTDGWFRTGDLGRLDDEGRLFIVGRKKDVIVDGDGRNVYPDELEEAYGQHSRISELSIVGLPSSAGERVACLCVPDYPSDGSRQAVKAELEAHFKAVSDSLPYHKRIKVLELWDGTLPRTAKRSVKRAEVAKILVRLTKANEAVAKVDVDGNALAKVQKVISGLTGRASESIGAELRIASDLGFDSLTYVELANQLENHVNIDVTTDLLMGLERVSDVAALLEKHGRGEGQRRGVGAAKNTSPRAAKDALIFPKVVQTIGKSVLRFGQRRFYSDVMDCEVRGTSCIPRNSNFLVAANHASHLDAGLIKTTLGDYGKTLVALAARDYFWGAPIIRMYTENFTDLVPIERHGAVKQSMRRALAILDGGDSLLIFPEGTRSEDGKLMPFKPSIGYLAAASKKPVLPAYLSGTHEAMPKGSTLLPKEREIGIVYGPPIYPHHVEKLAGDAPNRIAHQLCTRLVELAVHALKDQGTYRISELIERVRREREEQGAKTNGGGMVSPRMPTRNGKRRMDKVAEQRAPDNERPTQH